jgi:hypothetical protein
MHRSRMGWSVAALTLLGGLAALSPLAPAAAPPFAGSWSVTVLSGLQEITIWAIQIEEKDGKPQLRITDGLGDFKDADIEDVKIEPTSLQFTFKARGNAFAIRVAPPKGEEKAKQLLGTVTVRGQVEPVILDAEGRKFNAESAATPLPGSTELRKLLQKKDPREQEAGLRELQKTYATKPLGLFVAQALLQADMRSKQAIDKVEADGKQYVELATAYGPLMERQALLQVARSLARSEPGAALAACYARRVLEAQPREEAEAKTLSVLKVLSAALHKAGKTEEAKEVDARVAALEKPLDEAFLKKAVPFEPQAPAGRKSQSDRVVLVELFTGAQCPPCVAADIAFDAALKVYKPSEVALLQYHLHIPGPDPLTNADSEARAAYYGEMIEGTPTVIVDGKATAPLGGFADNGKQSYETLREVLDKALDTKPQAHLRLDVRRTADKIDLQADVTDLKKTGEKVRLRFVLLEEVVHYAGRNGQRLHHHVVRSYPGGTEGVALKEATAKESASVNLAELARKLEDYLISAEEKRPFPDFDRPLNLQHLKVVAFIQDDENRGVLQAVQMDVPPAK